MQQPQVTIEPDRILTLQLRADHALALLNLVGNMPISSGMAPVAAALGAEIQSQALTAQAVQKAKGKGPHARAGSTPKPAAKPEGQV